MDRKKKENKKRPLVKAVFTPVPKADGNDIINLKPGESKTVITDKIEGRAYQKVSKRPSGGFDIELSATSKVDKKKDLADDVKDLVKQKVPQKQIGEILGMSQSYVSKLKNK